MSTAEKNTLDIASLLMRAYDLGESINRSREVAEYVDSKQRIERHAGIQELVARFDKKKELFEETERFGHFHPDYHAAKDEVEKVRARLDEFAEVRSFKAAEASLDELLYAISETIARAVSDTIKVPSNDPLPKSGGCGAGGACSGKCG